MTREQMSKGARIRPLARAVLRTQSDERLVRLVREGRDAAFEEIVRRYRPPLVAFAAAYDPADPEDVVQESLTRSWQSLRQSTGEMNLKPWLYTIVRNRALNAKRDARVHGQLTERIDGVPQPADIVLTNDELSRVVTAVGALPEQQREALVRSALEGHTHEQIAEAIGATPGAVRQLIFRGRTAVRQGVGLLIPLPLVRLFAENGAVAEAGAGGVAAASGGAALTGGAASAGAGAGASLAAKAAIVAAVGAVAAGSGVAIHHARESNRARQPIARETVSEASRGSSERAPAATPIDDISVSSSSGSGPGEAEPGDDRRGTGSGSDGSTGGGDNHGGPGPSDDSDSNGPSPSSGSSGSSGSSESGPSASSGSGDDGSHSGSPDGSGASGSGSSGSGTSGSSDDGSGSSGSGTSGSSSSGSGAGSGSDGSGSSDSGTSGSSGSGSSSSDDGSDSSGSGSDSSGSSGSSGAGSDDSLDLDD